MHRSSVRFFAIIILALLGAPVTMHVMIHDLHHDDEQHGTVIANAMSHGDHEHPIVPSASPQIASFERAALPVAAAPATTADNWTRTTRTERNVVSLGALRTDEDVGLQPLLSTFLI